MWKEATPEEEEEMIEKAVDLIFKHGLETMAILLLETAKPMVYIGSGLGRFYLAPLVPLIGHQGDIFFSTFEKRENLEKIMKKIEERMNKRREAERAAKRVNKEINKSMNKGGVEKTSEKKGIIWRLKKSLFQR